MLRANKSEEDKTMSIADQSRETYDADRDLSFEQIHKKYYDKVFGLVLRFIGPDKDDTAGQLTDETFPNAWRHWHRFRGGTKVSTWLYQIASNCCKNWYKQRIHSEN